MQMDERVLHKVLGRHLRISLWVIMIVGGVILSGFPARGYQIGELNVKSVSEAGLSEYFKKHGWQLIKARENELILKIMTLEPVVRRSEFITHEVIKVAFYQEDRSERQKGNIKQSYPLPVKENLTSIVGIMLQSFIQEGFEIGKNSSFVKISGENAYQFELKRARIPIEKWLQGQLPIKYAIHIIIWHKGWYLITYCNFDTSSPGDHFFDFKIFLQELEFS